RLREHFVGGRLTVDELEDRVALALRAHSTRDLRRALRVLPGLPELAGRQNVVQAMLRGAALVVLTGRCIAVSFVLLCALALTMMIQGPSAFALLAFFVVWVVPTFFLSRMWRRSVPRRLF